VASVSPPPQNVSILVLAAGVILAFIVYRRPPIAEEVPSSRPIPETSITHANS
jgi:hypothetical protein